MDEYATIVDIITEIVEEEPPLLYDLTALQIEANRRYGLTAAETLDSAQKLYEAELLTYPRTSSHYITPDMVKTVSSLLSGAENIASDNDSFSYTDGTISESAALSNTEGIPPARDENGSEPNPGIVSFLKDRYVEAEKDYWDAHYGDASSDSFDKQLKEQKDELKKESIKEVASEVAEKAIKHATGFDVPGGMPPFVGVVPEVLDVAQSHFEKKAKEAYDKGDIKSLRRNDYAAQSIQVINEIARIFIDTPKEVARDLFTNIRSAFF